MTLQVTEVQKALKGAQYPSSGQELAELARSNGGDDELVQRLEEMDELTGPDDVMRNLKGSLTGGNDS